MKKAKFKKIFTEEEQYVLRFALKMSKEDIRKIWDKKILDAIWVKVGGVLD